MKTLVAGCCNLSSQVLRTYLHVFYQLSRSLWCGKKDRRPFRVGRYLGDEAGPWLNGAEFVVANGRGDMILYHRRDGWRMSKEMASNIGLQVGHSTEKFLECKIAKKQKPMEKKCMHLSFTERVRKKQWFSREKYLVNLILGRLVSYRFLCFYFHQLSVLSVEFWRVPAQMLNITQLWWGSQAESERIHTRNLFLMDAESPKVTNMWKMKKRHSNGESYFCVIVSEDLDHLSMLAKKEKRVLVLKTYQISEFRS